ncbi:uncharacterized protein LOC141596015 isoform X2 [Silene latifolia]|uniref:uncharacterized protein LOC141596015 isoform X2 n=1 Tax=Silene latifolia TaxID=37657 RepID=UPI003D776086
MHLKAAIYIFLLITWFDVEFGSTASNSFTSPQFVKDPETLVSSNAIFQLGFFSPTNSTSRYLGIWFNNKLNSENSLEVVWVANRDSPVKDSSAVFKISDDGNLQVMDAEDKIYWSSNTSTKANSSVVQLLDTGNLILSVQDSNIRIWQSFDNPTDSFLSGTKLTFNKSLHDTKTNIQSWKSNNDPSSGRFRIASLPRDLTEFFIVSDDKPYWRTGPWNGYRFIGTPYSNSEVSSGFNVDDHDGTVDLSFELADKSFWERYVLTYDGILLARIWNDNSSSWESDWQSLDTECDVYSKCGKFAVCDSLKEPICECLRGFTPENVEEWRKGNWTNGCVRRTELQCHIPGSKQDKFLHMKQIKVPDYARWILASADDCQGNCIGDCSCLAYSYYTGVGCMLWNASLIDLQQYSEDGADLFIRLANSELPGESGKKKIITAVCVIFGALFVSIAAFFLWKRMAHKNGKRATPPSLYGQLAAKRAPPPPKETEWQNIFGAAGCSNDFQDLPLFEFTKLADATDNFSEMNKLGQGGFGPVYKGKWEDGQDIAVKRLSSVSGQGQQEFMNEVMVISKLQHKNLVRLLGCSVEGEEKLLVYELVPNKSLDALLFDPQQCKLLDWQKRFNIIKGICRGLLYLHRDSRLRIIHRDLKPSNILLDEELNPKISDFGVARIFGSKQDQANTLRVVGTYGYMSPEYAMEGQFSEKSDVFSLGVLLLEIVSGRRNQKLAQESLNLLTYAWKMWNENNMLSLIDPTILDQRSKVQLFKCIQVGLLCVQEFPEDRPDVPALISMLDVDDAKTLPIPKQPGFTQHRVRFKDEILPNSLEDCSDPETLVSSNAIFQLGFFSPTNSTSRYLGIWFNNKLNSENSLEVVWVANRDSPVKDSSAVFKISDDGDLQVMDAEDKDSNIRIWQSFDNPTDSFLSGTKLTFNKSLHDTKTNIQSWKSNNDPSSGRFRIASLPRDLTEFFIVDGDKPYWRSGPWNGYRFIGIPFSDSEVSSGFNVDDHDGTVDLSFELADKSFWERYVLTYDGILSGRIWNDNSSSWESDWQSLDTECDVYSKCGKFAICDSLKEPICECLRGFTPENVKEWRKGNWTNGCVRRTELQCQVPGSKQDKFLHMKQIKVPDYARWILASADDCQGNCIGDCSCLAYSYYTGVGCMLWNASLIDLQQYSEDGADLFIRLANSELPGESGKKKIITAVCVIFGALFVSIAAFFLWKRMAHKNGKRATPPSLYGQLAAKRAPPPPKETEWQNIFGAAGCSNDFQDLPLFEFTKLADATDNFSEMNKLGQGGFGPVYKGKWEDGQDIAVKRLSSVSGQGQQEFMNEVMVISKLQHKNLVRLLGCSVEGEEKLLVYELVPNKSLDALLFDPQQCKLLDWQKRFNIIKGICRGLLYLHRDSRLRIIHRDLKPSNILLDEELNPKISDFGLARIFGSKQDQANTLRVVGTYGYMSPEYAMEGQFSEKSDVFSLGVLLLEIVSGKRNHKLAQQSFNLLTYAWKMWNENNMLSLIDPAILDQCSKGQLFKCIQVGLLCVQEFPEDRPDVPALISMLDVDDAKTLPIPKQPGFTRNKVSFRDEILPNCPEDCSVNYVSMTALSGR